MSNKTYFWWRSNNTATSAVLYRLWKFKIGSHYSSYFISARYWLKLKFLASKFPKWNKNLKIIPSSWSASTRVYHLLIAKNGLTVSIPIQALALHPWKYHWSLERADGWYDIYAIQCKQMGQRWKHPHRSHPSWFLWLHENKFSVN